MGKIFTDPQTKRQAVIDGSFADTTGMHSTTYRDKDGWSWLIDASGRELTGGGQYKASINPVQIDPATNDKTAVNPYGAKPGRTVAAADDFLGIAEAIDDAVTRWKMEQKAKGKDSSWLWLILLGVLVLTDKKR
jgi:hypothetical protein